MCRPGPAWKAADQGIPSHHCPLSPASLLCPGACPPPPLAALLQGVHPAYPGVRDASLLGSVERYYLAVSGVPWLEQRLSAMALIKGFDASADQVSQVLGPGPGTSHPSFSSVRAHTLPPLWEPGSWHVHGSCKQAATVPHESWGYGALLQLLRPAWELTPTAPAPHVYLPRPT
jgi:hypothetical protein